MTIQKNNQYPELIPLKDWEKTEGIFSTRKLRQLVFENTDNFQEVLVRVNRRIYICKESFYTWLQKTNPQWNYPRFQEIETPSNVK